MTDFKGMLESGKQGEILQSADKLRNQIISKLVCYFKLCYLLIYLSLMLEPNIINKNSFMYPSSKNQYALNFRLKDKEGFECEELALLWELIGSKQVSV